MAKLYVPFDYRTINRGWYEIEVPDGTINNSLSDIRAGKFDIVGKGTIISEEEVMNYDRHIMHKDVLTENKYLEELNLKETNKGFSINGSTDN